MPDYGITGPGAQGTSGHFAWTTAAAAAINQIGKFLDAELDNPSGLAAFNMALMRRSTAPAVIVTCGSSTVFNAGQPEAERHPAKILAELQAYYPSSATPAVRTLAAAVGSPPSGPGIHLINAGVSGSRSGDQNGATPYLTSTTRSQIVSMGPHSIWHMVTSNDEGNGVPSATVEANIRAHLVAFDALGYKFGHVLFFPHERYDDAAIAARVEPRTKYLAALRNIAADRRDVSVVDLSRDFNSLGIPSTDPFGIMNADKIHLLAEGQTFLAKLILRKLFGIVRAEATPPPSQARTILTSDTFVGAAASMSGRSTNAALGGSALAYQSSAFGGWGVNSSGQLYSAAAATEFLALPVTASNQAFTFTLPALTSATGTVLCSFDFRRSALASASNTSYRLRFRTDGSMSLHTVSAGTENTTALQTVGAGSATAGAGIEVIANGTSISVLVNGSTAISVTDSLITASSFAGFTKSSSVTSAVFDDLVIYTYN